MPRTANYLKTLLFLTLLWMLGNVLYNLVVDPFGAWHWVHRDGFNAIKARANKFQRIAAPLVLQRVEPGRLFLGTSRVEDALSSKAPALGNNADLRTINLGIRGASIYEIMLLFQHALQVAPVHEAVLGLEIHAFSMPGPGRVELDAYVARDWQGRRNYDYRLQQFRDSLFAIDVTAKSMDTLEMQAAEYDLVADDGRFQAEKTLHMALDGGSTRDYFGRWVGQFVKANWTPCPSGEVVFRHDEQFDSFARFRDLLVLAARRKVDLKLFISPSHVLLMEAMMQSGVWPYSEQWKSELLAIVDDVNREYGSDFRLVDFEGIDRYSTEPIPPGDQPMAYYHDPLHYSPRLGDLILARLYSDDTEPDWGVSLRRTTLPGHFQRIRSDLERYARDHPAEAAFVLQLVDQNMPLRADAASCHRPSG